MKNVVEPMKFGQTNHLAPVNPARHAAHRNGAGHLAAMHAADLRVRAHDSAQKAGERGLVSGTWSTDLADEEPAEEFVFVTTVTCGEDGGAPAENGFLAHSTTAPSANYRNPMSGVSSSGVVLVVDDDKDIRETIAEALTDEGYTVHEASDGKQALAILSRMTTHPCLVLLDLMMPRMNGTEFLASVRDDPRLAKLPIVVISASAASVYRDARRVLTKPISLERLLGIVEEFCAPPYAA